MKEKRIVYSVFAPAFNEKGNIIPLYREISEVMDSLKEPWEMIFVNDGSTDSTLEEMKRIKESTGRNSFLPERGQNKNIVIVNLKKRYGQSIAMDAGFKACSGEYVISIDADLQNDPHDIPAMIQKLKRDNIDVVCGWRPKRKDPLWMRLATRTARSLRRLFIGQIVHDQGCTLRAYKRDVVRDLELWGEMHRYLVSLLAWNGARIGEMRVRHRARKFGNTKYRWDKIFRGFVDMLYIWFWKKYSSRPLHLFGLSGGFIFFLGILVGMWTFYLKITKNIDLSENGWFIVGFFLVMIGMLFFMNGILIDLTIRTYYARSKEKRYYAERIEKTE